MIKIDGSYGEGGGQILRTALSLSLVTGKSFAIHNIRAGRKKSGLMRQHLTALAAAAEIGNAEVDGDYIGSAAFTFTPQTIRAGHYHFSIGSAGSCALVLQTILPALILAPGPSEIILEGGTHNPFAPPFDFLEKAFLPLVNRMGPKVSIRLESPGFFPAGGGKISVSVNPAERLTCINIGERGIITGKTARALVANLGNHIALRELAVIRKKTGWPEECFRHIEVRNSIGPGNIVFVEIESGALTEVFTGFGERGVSAEKVAEKALKQASEYLAADVPVGKYLADQLLVPMALAGGGSFLTISPTLHTRTNCDVIRQFLNIEIDLHEIEENRWTVQIHKR